MRRTAILAGIVAALAATGTAGAKQAVWHRCHWTAAGSGHAWSVLQVQTGTCSAAAIDVADVFVEHAGRALPDNAVQHPIQHIGAFRCVLTVHHQFPDGYAKVLCKARGGRRVQFLGY